MLENSTVEKRDLIKISEIAVGIDRSDSRMFFS
jgi:hypothetical protein